MHELPVISRVVEVCVRHAQQNNARRILKIELKVGPFSDLEPEWMQRYFDHVSKETLAAGARLEIEKLPLIFRCVWCEHEFAVPLPDIDADGKRAEVTCPECGNSECSCIAEKGYRIGNMEIV